MKSPKVFIALLMFVLLGICEVNAQGVHGITTFSEQAPPNRGKEPIELPDYGNKLLISNQEKKLVYLQAIAGNLQQQILKRQGPGDCIDLSPVTKIIQITQVVMQAEQTVQTTDGKQLIELYKFNDNSPLFVIRLNIEHPHVNLTDIKIYTNPEKTEITKVEFTDYKAFLQRENTGTLDSPVFEIRTLANILRKGFC